jgi:hypothetical protein
MAENPLLLLAFRVMYIHAERHSKQPHLKNGGTHNESKLQRNRKRKKSTGRSYMGIVLENHAKCMAMMLILLLDPALKTNLKTIKKENPK